MEAGLHPSTLSSSALLHPRAGEVATVRVWIFITSGSASPVHAFLQFVELRFAEDGILWGPTRSSGYSRLQIYIKTRVEDK